MPDVENAAAWNDSSDADRMIRLLRFRWWKQAYLAALQGLAARPGFPVEKLTAEAVNIANHAAPAISQAQEHFVVKGLVEPDKP